MSMTNIDCGFLTPAEAAPLIDVARNGRTNATCDVPDQFKPTGFKMLSDLWILIINGTGAPLTDMSSNNYHGELDAQPSPIPWVNDIQIPAPRPIYDKQPAGTKQQAGDIVLYDGTLLRKVDDYPSFGIYEANPVDFTGLHGPYGAMSFKTTGFAPYASGFTLGWGVSYSDTYCTTDMDFKSDTSAMATKMDNAPNTKTGYATYTAIHTPSKGVTETLVIHSNVFPVSY